MPMSARRSAEQRRTRKALHWHATGLNPEEICNLLDARPSTLARILAHAGVGPTPHSKRKRRRRK